MEGVLEIASINMNLTKTASDKNKKDKKSNGSLVYDAPINKLAENMAYYATLPAEKRDASGLMGLQNQGATCYLNALIQMMFMCPELRRTILSIDLCQKNSSKFKVLFALQKLFGEMQWLDCRSVSTEEITQSFGWQNNEHSVQHDIQEAQRVFFDVLDLQLYQIKSLKDIYHGVEVSYIQCQNCKCKSEQEAVFYDKILQVHAHDDPTLPISVESALQRVCESELLNQNNQYFCQTCQSKQDATKGVVMRRLPDILTLSLNRFTYDFDKEQRVKLDNKFTFGLELDCGPFMENGESHQYQNQNSTSNNEYELQTVLVHAGNAHHGHYHAYIRDCFGEGKWAQLMSQNNKLQPNSGPAPALISEQLSETKLRQTSEKAQSSPIIVISGDEEQEEIKKWDLKSQTKLQTNQIKQKTYKNSQKIKSQNLNKSGSKQSAIKQQKQNKALLTMVQEEEQDSKDEDFDPAKNGLATDYEVPQRQTRARAAKSKGKEKANAQLSKTPSSIVSKEQEDAKFDNVPFPIAYKNANLGSDWFDMNDGQITAIPVNRLQKQFGGTKGGESAYILIYRRKGLQQLNSHYQVPTYLREHVEEKNRDFEEQRREYEQLKRHIRLLVLPLSCLDLTAKRYINPDESEATVQNEAMHLEVSLDGSLSDLLHLIKISKSQSSISANSMNQQQVNLSQLDAQALSQSQETISIVEFEKLNNGLLHFKRKFAQESTQEFSSIEKCEIKHDSTWIVYNTSQEQQCIRDDVEPFIGAARVPFKLNIRCNKATVSCLCYEDQILRSVKEYLTAAKSIPIGEQVIYGVLDFEIKQFSVDDDATELKELGVNSSSVLIVKHRCDLPPKDTQQQKQQKDDFIEIQDDDHDESVHFVEIEQQVNFNKGNQQQAKEAKMQFLQIVVEVEIEDCKETDLLVANMKHKLSDLQSQILHHFNLNDSLTSSTTSQNQKKYRLRQKNHKQFSTIAAVNQIQNNKKTQIDDGVFSQDDYDIDLRELFNIDNEDYLNESSMNINNKGAIIYYLILERGEAPLPGFVAFVVQYTSQLAQQQGRPLQGEVILNCKMLETCQNVLERACAELGLDMQSHRLYTSSGSEQEIHSIKYMQKSLKANKVCLGARLYVRDVNSPAASEMLQISVYRTYTGMPDDVCKLAEVQLLAEGATLAMLKEKILALPSISEEIYQQNIINYNIQMVRLRELKRNMFFGKWYRNDALSLFKHRIENGDRVVLQLLDKEERLAEDDMILFVSRRQIPSRTYSSPVEVLFKASKSPTLQELLLGLQTALQIDGTFDVCKHMVTEFKWLRITHQLYVDDHFKKNNNKNKKKKKKVQLKAAKDALILDQNSLNQIDEEVFIENLRRKPVTLKEGDHIAYVLDQDDPSKLDDLQTEEDLQNILNHTKMKDKKIPAKHAIERPFQIISEFEEDKQNQFQELDIKDEIQADDMQVQQMKKTNSSNSKSQLQIVLRHDQ